MATQRQNWFMGVLMVTSHFPESIEAMQKDLEGTHKT